MVRTKVREPIRTGAVPFYAVIDDGVTAAHTNQEVLSVCSTYVDVSGIGPVHTIERLLDFAHPKKTTGLAVAEGILQT